MQKPKLSIVCVTYNHEKYITQAIDSFLKQKVNFSIEIIIADDASTDSTPKIIKKYEKKYPEIFNAILRTNNIGVARNFNESFHEAKGEYVALCEGDDYWLDDTKLQRQVDFLEKHKDYALVFHPVRVFFETGDQPDSVYPDRKKDFTLDRLLKENFIQTNSVVYRNKGIDIPQDIMPIDWYIHLYHAKFGRIGFINRVMAAYRRHSEGVWFDSIGHPEKLFIRHSDRMVEFWSEIIRLYPEKKYKKAISESLRYIVDRIANSYSAQIIQHNDSLKHENMKLILQNKELERSIGNIRNSLSWRITSPLRSINHAISSLFQSVGK